MMILVAIKIIIACDVTHISRALKFEAFFTRLHFEMIKYFVANICAKACWANITKSVAF